MSKRLPRWLGTLLAPAEDPRRGRFPEADSASADPEALLAELRRSRTDLAALRARLSPSSTVSVELAEEEQALQAAERGLEQSLDERRARAVLLEARRRAADAEAFVDF